MITDRRPRDFSLPFSWRAELWSLAAGCAWIGGTMLVWYGLIQIGLR